MTTFNEDYYKLLPEDVKDYQVSAEFYYQVKHLAAILNQLKTMPTIEMAMVLVSSGWRYDENNVTQHRRNMVKTGTGTTVSPPIFDEAPDSYWGTMVYGKRPNHSKGSWFYESTSNNTEEEAAKQTNTASPPQTDSPVKRRRITRRKNAGRRQSD